MLVHRGSVADLNVPFAFRLASTPSGGSTTYGSFINTTSAEDYSSFDGWNTPNFHKRKAAGELLPQTPFECLVYKSTLGTCEYDIKDNGNVRRHHEPSSSFDNYKLTAAHFSPVGKVASYLAGMDPQVYVQAAADRIATSGADLLTFIAEFTQLRSQFSGLIKRFQSQVSKYEVPSTKRGVVRNIKQLSNDWLEGRFGWRTLAFDMEDFMDAYFRMKVEERKRWSQRSGTRRQWTTTTDSAYNGTYFTSTMRVIDEISVSVRGSVVADIGVANLQLNPFKTAWELVPFSFVVDWFITVGSSIGAATLLTLATDLSASQGFIIEVKRQAYPFGFTAINGATLTNVQYYGSSEISYRVRTPCTVSIIPQFSLRLNDLKFIDLISLIIQKLV